MRNSVVKMFLHQWSNNVTDDWPHSGCSAGWAFYWLTKSAHGQLNLQRKRTEWNEHLVKSIILFVWFLIVYWKLSTLYHAALRKQLFNKSFNFSYCDINNLNNSWLSPSYKSVIIKLFFIWFFLGISGRCVIHFYRKK